MTRIKNAFLSLLHYGREIKRFTPFLLPYRRLGFVAGFWMSVAVLLQLPMPLLSIYLIDTIIPKRDLRMLNLLTLGLLSILAIRSVALFLQRIYLVKYRGKVVFNLRTKLFQHIQRLPVSFFDENASGYLMSRIDGDVNQLQGMLAETFLQLAKDLITFFTGCCLLFYFHPRMAAVALVFLPFFYVSFQYFGKRMRALNLENREQYAKYNGVLEEEISMITLVKSFCRYKFSAVKFAEKLKRSIRTDIRTELTGSLSGIVTGLFAGLAPLLILWYGIFEIVHQRLTLGQFFAFNSLLAYLYAPLNSIVDLNIQIQACLASAQRIHEIFEMEPERDSPQAIALPKSFRPLGHIRFDHVSYQYPGEDRPVIKEISFEVQKGEKIAFVGSSGSGKSTIAKILMRFLSPQNGCVFFDGYPADMIRRDDLRRRIGYMSQQTLTYSGSIIQNLRFGNVKSTTEDCCGALEIVDMLEKVQQLPQGFQTILGQGGAGLSGGELQRLALARCILKNPDIFILDEATSGIDGVREMAILQRLGELFPTRTMIFITHRLESVRNVDRIIVIREGRVVETGDHHSLMSLEGHYHTLYTKNQQEKLSFESVLS